MRGVPLVEMTKNRLVSGGWNTPGPQFGSILAALGLEPSRPG